MATILVNGQPWEYEATSYYETEVFEHDDAKEMFLTLSEILNKNSIVFMPMFGTLLGFIRDHGFIKNDYDVDLMIYEKDSNRLINLIPVLHEHGIDITRTSEPWVYTFKYKSASCDFYTLRKAAWPYSIRYCRIVENYIQKSYFESTEKIQVFGIQVDVPKNPEILIEYMYGKNWRIPQKGQAKTQTNALIHINAYRFVKKCISYIKRHYICKK